MAVFSDMTPLERSVRLYIYQFTVRTGRCPTLNEISEEAGLSPLHTQDLLNRLQSLHEAIVLSPGSGNLWLADPFAALPTPYPVLAGERRWFGMCVWDALGILSLTGLDGTAPTRCPVSGEPLILEVRDGRLVREEGVIHFAVRARDWWRDLGFT